MFNVNVVFHGVFAFVLNPKEIEVAIPYFSPHQYLFGSWGELEPLPKGEMHIEGLSGIETSRPDPDFSPEHSPTVHNFREKRPENLFSIIKLPHYPAAVHFFRPYGKPTNFGGVVIDRFPFTGLHGASINPTSLSGPVVLSYTADDPERVDVVYRGKPLKFHRKIDGAAKAFNLHFFSEGENDLPPENNRDRIFQAAVHYQEAWTRLTNTIAGLDIRLGELWPFVLGHTDPLPPDTRLPGLPPIQVADLDELFELKRDPHNDPFGGRTDCNKAHLVVDNRY